MSTLPHLELLKTSQLEEPEDEGHDRGKNAPLDKDCLFSNSEERHFRIILAFMHEALRDAAPEDTIDLTPHLIVSATPDGTELKLEGREDVLPSIPEDVVARVALGAIYKVGHEPHNVEIRIAREGFNAGQVIAVQALGVKAVHWGNLEPLEQALKREDKENRQQQWSEEYEKTKKTGTRSDNDPKELNPQSREDWLAAVDRSLEHALLEEAKHGLEATAELFEAARIQCSGALSALLTEEDNGVTLDPMFLVKYAGCLARLSSCIDLKDYDHNRMHPATKGRNRNNDLFDSAIKMYEEAEEILGLDATDREWFLVSSGLAHAYALRHEYTKAIQELEGSKKRISSTSIRAQIERQIDDTHEFESHNNVLELGRLPVADQVLCELAAA